MKYSRTTSRSSKRPGTVIGKGTHSPVTEIFEGAVVPGIRGSAAPFVYLLRSAGIFAQPERRRVLRRGDRVLDCGAAEWLQAVLAENGARVCDCCGTTAPPSSGDGDAEVTICGHCGSDGHGH